ncbi:MAG: ATP-binding protein [Gemmatimonadota bacterium]|nr:ATP-binding protein [Gemmatimonadota bacterium]
MSQSPFKFLDAYQKEDKDRFFGRERETAQLYNAVHASNLVLVYGASGTGKTSIINCGLGNQFVDSDWLPLYVRRGTDLNRALEREITGAMKQPGQAGEVTITGRIRALYLDHYRPIYLVLDQFEELFISGTVAEQQLFYETVRQILAAGASCKLLIVIREEYIAYLSALEKVIPSLFDNRLRIEKMNDSNLARIIIGTARAAGIQITDPPATASGILENIRDRRTGIDLTNLQLYLDRLWRADLERQGTATPATVTFDPPLVEGVGKLGNVLSAFLDEQLALIEAALAKRGVAQPQGVPLEVLFALVTEEGTKRNLDVGGILDALPGNSSIGEPNLRFCLAELERVRLVRPLAGG